MEYEELALEEQRNMLRNELRSFEAQHMGRMADVRKHAALIAAAERGEFSRWGRRAVDDRVTGWKQAKEQAEIDVAAMEMMIADAKERLAALPEPPSEDDEE